MNIPVTVCNDVRAATWGEWLYGAGKDCDNLICILIGTGIGSGIVSGGKILEGYNNTADEIGHITIDMNGPVCHCGNKGCFEALAGGWAIERDARQAVAKDNDAGKHLLSLAGGDI
jgi:glucokinase